jgi:hypothetical protein
MAEFPNETSIRMTSRQDEKVTPAGGILSPIRAQVLLTSSDRMNNLETPLFVFS